MNWKVLQQQNHIAYCWRIKKEVNVNWTQIQNATESLEYFYTDLAWNHNIFEKKTACLKIIEK